MPLPEVKEHYDAFIRGIVSAKDELKLSDAEVGLICALRRADEFRPVPADALHITEPLASTLIGLLSTGCTPNAGPPCLREAGIHPPPWPAGTEQVPVSDEIIDALRLAGELPSAWYLKSLARLSREAAAALLGAAGHASARRDDTGASNGEPEPDW